MTPQIVLIVGPTAAGKTAIAMSLFDAVGGAQCAKLISVDSALVYRGMDIGTAKPTADELARYPHALIDIKEPNEVYSVADFVRDADREVQTALDAGQHAILVGGTMLYAKKFIEGIAELPEADTTLRSHLQEEYESQGGERLYAELERIDPQAAAEIHPNNPQRLLRALEVIRLTGSPISALWASQQGESVEHRLGLAPHVFGLFPQNRAKLHAVIAQRFDAMLDAGFLAEVEALRARGDLDLDMPSMRAVGYRQAWLHLAGDVDFEQFQKDAKTATRRLAKRQLTWMRQWAGLERLDVDHAQATVSATIERILPVIV